MTLPISIVGRLTKSPLGIALNIIICLLFVSACSGSSNSDSSADNNLDLSNSATVQSDDDSGAVIDDSTSSATSSPADTSDDSPDTSTIESDSPTATETAGSETGIDTTESGPVTTETTTESSNPATTEVSTDPEPVVTRVDFDITVPVYVSNSLQVQLTWGDRELSAGWVVDETWAVSEEFPSDTENLLSIRFVDQNGAVVLGSYEASYRTGTSPSETVSIGADQFDTGRWDTDGDGVSNLDESIAGTDPAAAPDPSTQTLVRVDFGITVPVFVSDALQLRLVWGDEEITASWVGDESWSAFADLPADTEEPLIVTFYDRNGELPIGSFETTYQTGTNDSEYFQIESRNINTNRFDNDLDGVSNFSELQADTDPDVSDSEVPVTFASVQQRFTRCGGCHFNYRNLDELYEVLLSQVSRDDEPMVVPFEPESSYLVNKLDGTMQRFGGPSMAQLVRAWIATGALDN